VYWAWDIAFRTTSPGLVQRPVMLVGVDLNKAFVGGPQEVAEQPQEQKQAARCGTDDEATDVAATANTIVATVSHIFHCWLHREFAPAGTYIHHVTVATGRTRFSRAIHACSQRRQSER